MLLQTFTKLKFINWNLIIVRASTSLVLGNREAYIAVGRRVHSWSSWLCHFVHDGVVGYAEADMGSKS